MGKIGDYVHHRAMHYVINGPEDSTEKKSGTKGLDQAKKAIEAKRKHIKSKINKLKNQVNQKDLDEMNTVMNEFWSQGINNGVTSEIIAAILMEEISRAMDYALDEEDIIFDYKTGKIVDKNIDKKVALISNQYEEYKKADEIFSSRLFQLQSMLKEYNKLLTGKNRVKDGRNIKTDLQKLNKIIDELFQGGRKRFSKTSVLKKGVLNEKETKKRVKEIRAITETWAKLPAYSLMEGDFFEHFLSLIPSRISQIATESISDVVRESIEQGNSLVKGGDTTTVKYNQDFFDANILNSSKSFDLGDETIARINSSGSAQQKTDVSFEWKSPNRKGKNRLYNISAKNIGTNSYWISLVNETHLDYLLQDENQENFVNHYLNLYSVKFTGNRGENDNTFKQEVSAIKQEMLDTLKILLIYKAMIGEAYGRQGDINTFALQQGGKIYIMSAGAILEKLWNNLEGNIKGINDTVGKNYDNTFIEGKDPNLKYLRINKILAQMHQKKLHLGIKPGLAKF